MSLVFNNLTDNPTGVVQGQSSDAGIRALLPISGDQFAIAGYQFSANYQIPSQTLSTGDITSSVNLYPGDMGELKSYTPSKIISYTTTSGSQYLIYASETESRQIILNIYDQTDSNLVGVKKIGFINPFTFSSIKVSSDNSIIILGTTLSAGRFERIMLTKISEEEFLNSIQ